MRCPSVNLTNRGLNGWWIICRLTGTVFQCRNVVITQPTFVSVGLCGGRVCLRVGEGFVCVSGRLIDICGVLLLI